MRYINLKGTELNISSVALGTDYYGSEIKEDIAFDIIDKFVSKGGNMIDTALIYGVDNNGKYGLSEKVIGKWLKSRSARKDIVIATKGAHEMTRRKNIHKIVLDDVMRDIDESLMNLNTDYVDIYWLHRDDLSSSTKELAEIIDTLKKSGKSRYVGVSNWKSDRINSINNYLSSPLTLSQIQFNLARSNMENIKPDLAVMNKHEFEEYSKNNTNVFAFCSQAKGFFQKMLIGEQNLSDKSRQRYLNEKSLENFSLLYNFSKENNISIGSLSMAILTSVSQFNVIPIIGSRNISQFEESISNIVFKVPEDLRTKLIDNCLI